jgi:hypothetical protein
MKIQGICLLAAIFMCASDLAQAQLGPPMSAEARARTRIYMEPTQDTATLLRQDLRWTSRIPLDKTYEQLTPAEEKELRRLYTKLPSGDEPPFPQEGMTPIYQALKKAHHILQARGELNMVVTVDSRGNATKVTDLGGVRDIQMTELTQQVLLLTKYKPAKCSGNPCMMIFPFTLRLKGG